MQRASRAGGSVLSVTEASSFHPAVPQEEMQAALLLSGFSRIRKPLVLRTPKPSVGQHLRSTAFSQEGSVLKELFSALFLLSMPSSTRDHPYRSNFGMGTIRSLDASPDSSIYWCNIRQSSSGWGGLSCWRCSPFFAKGSSGHHVSVTVLLRRALVKTASLMSKTPQCVL